MISAIPSISWVLFIIAMCSIIAALVLSFLGQKAKTLDLAAYVFWCLLIIINLILLFIFKNEYDRMYELYIFIFSFSWFIAINMVEFIVNVKMFFCNRDGFSFFRWIIFSLNIVVILFVFMRLLLNF